MLIGHLHGWGRHGPYATTSDRVGGLWPSFSISGLDFACSNPDILEVVNIVFGDKVQLGHFIEIAILIITMIVVRAAMQRIYERLGDGAAATVEGATPSP